jgi:hypothetical protein
VNGPVSARLAAATTLGITWARGVAYLHAGHPHEDAFILFRYAEHLAGGHGIVFNIGGAPTEGATDFLWMVLIAAGNVLGLDSALAALLLNAFGAAALSYVLVRAWTEGPGSSPAAWTGLALGLCVPFLPPAHSAYLGFSTGLYCGAFAATLWCATRRREASAVAAIYACLILSLLRPDGVVLGAGSWVVAMLLAPRHSRRRLTGHTIAVVGAGLLYFAWRYHYFGELLPLPLVVKSRASVETARLQMNMRWVQSASGPVPLLATTILLAVACRLRGTPDAVAPLLPAAMLLGALWNAHQTQNLDWRFQAPIYTALLMSTCMLAARWRRRRPGPVTVALSSTLVAGALIPPLVAGPVVFPRDYMDSAAVNLGPVLRGKTVVLTEAGRLPYWSDATVYDVVGLNHAHFAHHPPTVAFIEQLDPDVVMFHSADTVVPRRAIRKRIKPGRIVLLSNERLRGAVRKRQRLYLDLTRDTYDRFDVPTRMGAVVLADFLSRHPEYEVFAVRYGKRMNHIYGVRGAAHDVEAVAAALRQARPEAPESSYARVKGLGSGLLCRPGVWMTPHLPNHAGICP